MLDPQAVQHYRNKLKKTGVALTLSQLHQQLQTLRILASQGELSAFLAGEKLSARFACLTRPKRFQTIGVLRPGVYFMD